jgi:uncharacterized protein
MNGKSRDDLDGARRIPPRPVTQSTESQAWIRLATRLLAALCVLLAATRAQAGLEQGEAAYQRGDYAAAVAAWTPLAKAGRREAEYALGSLYYAGLGVAKNYRVAFGWLHRAARRGHPEAQYLFGMLHVRGEGTESDPQVGSVWLNKAARQGVVPAQYALGYLHAGGFLGKKDLEKATYWLERAALADHPKAQIALARVLRSPRNERADSDEAIRWINRASELGDPNGQNLVADRYLHERSYAKALDLYAKAAGQGHSGAQASLGRMYLQGDGVAVDYKTSFDWLCKAAAQGESSAFYNLGTIFLEGLGQTRDVALATALRWVARDVEEAAPGQVVSQYAPAGFTDGDVAAVSDLAAALESPGSFRSALDDYLRKPPLAVKQVGQKDTATRLVTRVRP